MEIRDLPALLEEELSYPVEQRTVIDQRGNVEIDAPNRQDTETIAEVLEPIGGNTYQSSNELFDVIIGSLGEEYIGRKFYDDRSGNSQMATELTERTNVSF